MTKKKKKAARLGCRILFCLYIILIFYFVLLSERYGRETGYETSHVNLVLFKEIKRFWMYRSLLTPEAFITNLAGNIFAFCPFGFLLPVMTEKKRGFIKVVAGTFAFSFIIESCQFIFKVGVFDVDDLLLNTVGGLIGYIIYKISVTIYRRR
ncbi:VanZ family protein [Anaerostipes sp.]|uniref:VanZ family protein n=1 Tax=Anaerostipes sp. TaxID=1872530 RepID=UPI0025C3A61D|nr:VanZ family protein [Anaerostipes sp.]MBS7007877.1 VanZ family protein [Anaerostipes sp.]